MVPPPFYAHKKSAVLHLRKTTELCLLSFVLLVREIFFRDIFFFALLEQFCGFGCHLQIVR
jgi:hypothetical protein